MANRPSKLPGVPWMVPHLTVRDVTAAVTFYARAFGWEKKLVTSDESGMPNHAEMVWKDSLIMLGPESTKGRDRAPQSMGGMTSVTLYVYVDDVDALHQRAVESGAKTLVSPRTEFWGDRICLLVDPEGHSWMFATHVGAPAGETAPTEEAAAETK
jgi:uncharacterized glyoxalase superfamily protein PhnB